MLGLRGKGVAKTQGKRVARTQGMGVARARGKEFARTQEKGIPRARGSVCKGQGSQLGSKGYKSVKYYMTHILPRHSLHI